MQCLTHDLPTMICENPFMTCLYITIYSCVCYFIILSIQEYFNYDVITNIRLYNEIPSIFPMVTICNLNLFTTNFSRDILINLDEYGNISDSLKLNIYLK